MSTEAQRKSKRVASVCAALALLQSGCNPQADTAGLRPEIKVTKKSSILGKFLLEYEPDTILNIGGKSFAKVRGYPPHYLPIRELNAVYFVTEGKGHQSVCHIFNLGTRKDIPIVTDATELGYELGRTGARSEVIEGYTNNTLIVGRHYDDTKTLYWLDLNQRKITDMEIQNPRLGTNHHRL